MPVLENEGDPPAGTVEDRAARSRFSGTDPSVSILMPAYQVAPYIGEAVRSVLAQTYEDWELVIIDDGSTDDILGALGTLTDDPRIKVHRFENGGLATARNRGLALARGSLIALLDSDDIYEPRYLERMTKALADDPTLGFVSCDATYFGSADRQGLRFSSFNPQVLPITAERLITRAFNVFIMVMMRAAAVRAVGGFSPDLRVAEDFDLWLRLVLAGYSGGLVPEVLGRYRRRPDSLSALPHRMLEGTAKVLHRTLGTIGFDHPASLACARQLAEHTASLYFLRAEELLRQGRLAEARALIGHALTELPRPRWRLMLALLRHVPPVAVRVFEWRERHYGRLPLTAETMLPDPSLVGSCKAIGAGPKALGMRPVAIAADTPPILQIVVDTESAFDWRRGPGTDRGDVSSIEALTPLVGLLQKEGISPCLVVDYNVAIDSRSGLVIRDALDRGCEVGVHLQAWSTPPLTGDREGASSFSGNLDPHLEREKLLELSRQTERLLGAPPRIFKAGRYGVSPRTYQALREMGFVVDLSLCPQFDFSGEGGPDFTQFTSVPAWVGPTEDLLALPTTSGAMGRLRRHALTLNSAVRRPMGRALRAQQLLKRLNLLYPQRLSPEGHDLEALKSLTGYLLGDGLRIFTLTFHSPSLKPGNTPYTSSDTEVAEFVERICAYVRYFRDELGGRFSSPLALYNKFHSGNIHENASPRD